MLIRRRNGVGRPAKRWTWKNVFKVLTSTGVAARAALFVVFTVLALSLSAPQPAKAFMDTCDWVDQSTNQKADMPGVSAENIFPSVRQWDGKGGLVSGAEKLPKGAAQYTLYELNSMRGLNWASTQVSQKQAKGDDSAEDDDCSIQNDITNSIGQMIFDLSKVMSRAAISVKEISSNPSPLAALYEETVEGKDSVVDRLNNRVFKFAVPTMILLTGIWVFGKWRKGDMREVWAGVGWAAFVVVAVSGFLVNGNYVAVVEKADSGIAQGNAVLTEAVLGSATGLMEPPCDLGVNATQRGMRVSSCAMYDTLAFRPWSIGQFGDPGKKRIAYKGDDKCDFGGPRRCSDLRVKQVVAQSVTNKDYYSGEKDITDKKEDEYGDLRKYMADDFSSGDYDQWSGRKPASRISIAIYALVASAIVGLMVIGLSLLTLLWHAVTLIMVILLPLIASISIHPTQQKLLRGWWETFVHSFVLRAGFGVILTVLLLFYQVILPLQVPLGMQLLMLLLVTVAVIMLLKNLLSGKFSPKVAGAEDALGIREAAETGSSKLVDKGQGAPGKALQVGGRVAGRTAAGTVRTADKKLLGGKLAKGGWIDVSARQKRKDSYGIAKAQGGGAAKSKQQGPLKKQVQPDSPELPEQQQGQQPDPEAQPTSRRRVSSSTGQQPAQTSVPTQPQGQRPAPQQPSPQQPQPRTYPTQPHQAQPQPHQPQPQAPQPPNNQPPPNPPRPNGRVS
ncbi:hypothetical protein [Streptomyces sp. H27-C3]|uniref:hypothetical protein n=1 Tax=Streptomyces sp. H27-C3 TaxID=3046305 RepID=UPI0024B98CAA|nr:hypothetical protein [Streptomyces sp. H27-C3]MDJ0464306.1 hypothetical protein [Streptomyces sp. H27-C3]